MVIKEEDDLKQKLINAQKKDTVLRKIFDAITKGELKKEETTAKFRPSFKKLKLIDGVIVKVRNDEKLIVVPEAFKLKILESAHNNGISCHFGLNKVYNALRAKYFWP